MFVGDEPLESFVKRIGLRSAVLLRDLIASLDLEPFTAAYKPGGRPPIHPRLLLGLIIYGIHLRQWSLRELELLAARDVGAWLLCEGICPDHSTIGKFVVRHAELLTDQFFVSVTKRLAEKMGVSDGEAAADGTVIQAATSLRTLAKQEVLEAEAAEARAEAMKTQAPRDRQRAETLERAVNIAKQRAEVRRALSRPPPQVSRTEPEATHQPCKDGAYRPAFKPSILVRGRLITGQGVESSSEVGAVEPMLDQAAAVGIHVSSLLLDTGYFEPAIIKTALSRGIDLLCGTKRPRNADSARTSFPKAAFAYDNERDLYICPAGEELRPGSWVTSRSSRYRAYGTKACGTCPLRSKCTTAKAPRKIARYEGEELKEVMQYVMDQPAAKASYRKRAQIVEPVFAELKDRQGLRRFRRRGLRGVRLEFALHCIAFNLKQAVVVVLAAALLRGSGETHLVWAALVVLPAHP
jgi:hypothetical protein